MSDNGRGGTGPVDACDGLSRFKFCCAPATNLLLYTFHRDIHAPTQLSIQNAYDTTTGIMYYMGISSYHIQLLPSASRAVRTVLGNDTWLRGSSRVAKCRQSSPTVLRISHGNTKLPLD